MNLTSEKSFRVATLTGLFLLTIIGCGSGTGSGTSPVTTQPIQPTQPVAPTVPAGWTSIDRQYFSFRYPTGWQFTEQTYRAQPILYATDPALQHRVMIQFVPGYPNGTTTTMQCADVINYLNAYYIDEFLRLVTVPGKYPRTSVTWQSLPAQGGYFGGAIGSISVVTQQAVGSTSGSYTVELQGVPRADGLYLVGIWNPDPLATPSFEQAFLSVLFLNSNVLPKGSNCSYLN